MPITHFVVLIGCVLASGNQPGPGASGDLVEGPVGLWVVPEAQLEAANARAEQARKNVIYGGPAPFYFHGDSATMHLFCEKAWMWHTPDHHYRVKTRWVGKELQWLPPFGRWQKLATLRDGVFEVEQSGIVWKYERVPKTMARDSLRPYLKKRAIHDYTITPMGGHDAARLKDLD